MRTPRCPQKVDVSWTSSVHRHFNGFPLRRVREFTPSKSTIDAKNFLSAFTVAQEGASKKIRQGKFRTFSEIQIPRQQRKQSVPLRRVIWIKHLPYVGCQKTKNVGSCRTTRVPVKSYFFMNWRNNQITESSYETSCSVPSPLATNQQLLSSATYSPSCLGTLLFGDVSAKR